MDSGTQGQLDELIAQETAPVVSRPEPASVEPHRVRWAEEWDYQESPEKHKIQPEDGSEHKVEDAAPWLDREEFTLFTNEDMGNFPMGGIKKYTLTMPIGNPVVLDWD